MSQNTSKILELKNIHEGDRCFILGNGPSLNKTDFNLIRNEYLFGCNKLYLGFDKFGISPQYYAITDPKITKYLNDLLNLDTILFIGGSCIPAYLQIEQKEWNANPILIWDIKPYMFDESHSFSKNLIKGAHNGWTIITDIMLQVAWWLGFIEIYLLGCDWDFVVQSHFYDNKKNTNHPLFHERTKISYEVCKRVFESDNKKIYNATPDSKLNVFERVNLEDII